MKKVIVYTSASCGYCQMAKQYFNQIGVKFEEKDVTDQKNAEEATKRSGQMGIPVIIIGEKVLTGFKKKEIDAALKEG